MALQCHSDKLSDLLFPMTKIVLAIFKYSCNMTVDCLTMRQDMT